MISMIQSLPYPVQNNIMPEPMSGCWLWIGNIDIGGYGRMYLNGTYGQAHRKVFEMINRRPIKSGLQIDHLCRNRCCVNPQHLEEVTPRENTMRSLSFAAINAKKTHCPKGHPYSSGNLITAKRSDGGVNRKCKICVSLKEKRRRGTMPKLSGALPLTSEETK